MQCVYFSYQYRTINSRTAKVRNVYVLRGTAIYYMLYLFTFFLLLHLENQAIKRQSTRKEVHAFNQTADRMKRKQYMVEMEVCEDWAYLMITNLDSYKFGKVSC